MRIPLNLSALRLARSAKAAARLTSILTGAVMALLGASAPLTLISQELPFSGIALAQSGEENPIVQARITVEREHTETASYIVVKVKLPIATSASSFVVSSPPRIVVDLEGTRIRKSSALAVPANKVLKQIRIGAHPEKLRIVLDVYTDPPPAFEQLSDGNSVTIKILEKGSSTGSSEASTPPDAIKDSPISDVATPFAPSKDDAAVAEAPTQSQEALTVSEDEVTPEAATPTAIATLTRPATPTETATPTLTPSPSATATATQPPPPTPLPTVAPSATATPTPDPKSLGLPPAEGHGGLVGDVSIGQSPGAAVSAQRVNILSYRFEYLQPGRIPILKILLSRWKVEVQRSKIDSKTYKIVIPSAGVANAQLTLPQFPPADFAGFTMVVAQEFDNRTEITITVDPGVTLGTFVRDNEIWVKRM